MSQVELSKAEEHFFEPGELIKFGVPEKCSMCPSLTHQVCIENMFLAGRYVRGELDPSTLKNRQLEGCQLELARDSLKKDRERVSDLLSVPQGCDGYETLSAEVTKPLMDKADYGPVECVVGYRCRKTGEAVVAITWESGVVGLLPLDEDLKPIKFFDDEEVEPLA